MPFIGDLDPAAAIAATDQIPIVQANLDGTTDTRRAPAALFAEWLIGQVTASIGGPATAYTDAALVTAKAYTDQVGASVTSSANGHADAVLVSAKSYADGVGGTATAATSAALAAAKTYADTAIADKATPPSATPNDRPAIALVGKPSRCHRGSAIADRWIDALDLNAGAMRSPNCSPCRPNTPPGATPCPTAFATTPPPRLSMPSSNSILTSSPTSSRRAALGAIDA